MCLCDARVATTAHNRRSVGKETRRPRRGAAGGRASLVPAGRPALCRNRVVLIPPAATIFVRRRDEVAVGLVPVADGQRWRPHRLGFGPDEPIAAITFEFASAAAVDQPIIPPRFADERVQGKQISHGPLRPGYAP